MTASNPTRFRRGLASCAALGLILALAGTAASQTPPLGAPDAPPPVTESVAPPAPEPDQPVTPASPSSPSPAPASPAPSSPSPPSSEPADASPSAAAAAAARTRLRQRRAAQAAERRQALRKVPAVAGRVGAAASTLDREGLAATADALAVSEADAPDGGGRGDIVLLALLVAAAIGIGLAASSRLAGRPGAVERFRLELVGVSVACMLTVALVLAGVV